MKLNISLNQQDLTIKEINTQKYRRHFKLFTYYEKNYRISFSWINLWNWISQPPPSSQIPLTLPNSSKISTILNWKMYFINQHGVAVKVLT